ncbi:MAG: hypothetical protein WC763_05475 [Candidatus Paceibacterota bacterium]
MRLFQDAYGARCKKNPSEEEEEEEEEEDAQSSVSPPPHDDDDNGDQYDLPVPQSGVRRPHAQLPPEIEELNDRLPPPPPSKKQPPLPDNISVPRLKYSLQAAQTELAMEKKRLGGTLAELAKLRAEVNARTEAIKQRKDNIADIDHALVYGDQSPESSSFCAVSIPTTTTTTAAATKTIDIIASARPAATTTTMMRPSPVATVDFGKSNPDLTDSESDGESQESLLSSSYQKRRQQPIVTINKKPMGSAVVSAVVGEERKKAPAELPFNPHRPIPFPHLRTRSLALPNVPTATTTAATFLSHAMPSVALTTTAPLYRHRNVSPPTTSSVSVSTVVPSLPPAVVEPVAPVAVLLQQQRQQEQRQQQQLRQRVVNSPSSISATAVSQHLSSSSSAKDDVNAVASVKQQQQRQQQRRQPVLRRPISIEVRRHPTNAKWLAVKILVFGVGILSATERAFHLEAVTEERLREALGVHGTQLIGITARQTDENNDAWHVAFEMNADYLKKIGGRTAIINSIGYYAEIQP